MRILIEFPPHGGRNVGDAAMLQMAVSRLGALWPDATIEVATRHPELLSRHCPEARAVAPIRLYGPTLRNMSYSTMLRYLRVYRSVDQFTRLGSRRSVLDAVREADLVVASGGGFITDSFQGAASHVLAVLGTAVQLGKPIALFGQGIGPVTSPRLIAKASAVLPSAVLIGLREGRKSLPELNALGVDPRRVCVTGDDALEPAYLARPEEMGGAIGVNLRIAGYSGVDAGTTESIRNAILTTAERYQAPLLPVPISHNQQDSDVRAIGQLLPGVSLSTPDGLDSLNGVIEQIGTCRVVVTGSYHAAVFALAQGIPAVCLSKAEYYDYKFLGLADLFGPGCTVISLQGTNLAERLISTIDGAWTNAVEFRPTLIEAARRQIEAGQAAYQQFFQTVSSAAEPLTDSTNE